MTGQFNNQRDEGHFAHFLSIDNDDDYGDSDVDSLFGNGNSTTYVGDDEVYRPSQRLRLTGAYALAPEYMLDDWETSGDQQQQDDEEQDDEDGEEQQDDEEEQQQDEDGEQQDDDEQQDDEDDDEHVSGTDDEDDTRTVPSTPPHQIMRGIPPVPSTPVRRMHVFNPNAVAYNLVLPRVNLMNVWRMIDEPVEAN